MKKTKVFGTITLILACLAVVLLLDIPKFLKYQTGDIKSINDSDLTLDKGDLVDGTVEYCWGWAVEQYDTTFGIRTSSNSTLRYYALELDKGTLLLYETGSSGDYSKLDQITTQTGTYYESLYDYLDGKIDLEEVSLPTSTLDIQGVVKTMPSDVRNLFKEWYEDDANFDADTEIYMITRSSFDRLFISLIIGAVAAVLAIVFLIVTIVTHKKEKYNQQFGY